VRCCHQFQVRKIDQTSVATTQLVNSRCSGIAHTTTRIASPQHIQHFFNLTSLSDMNTIHPTYEKNNPNHPIDWIHLSSTNLWLRTTKHYDTTQSNLSGPSILYDLHSHRRTLGSQLNYPGTSASTCITKPSDQRVIRGCIRLSFHSRMLLFSDWDFHLFYCI